MNKREKIQFYKRQMNASIEMQQLAMQNYKLATRIESEAKSALKMLGALTEQDRKVKKELPIDLKISLIGNLTK